MNQYLLELERLGEWPVKENLKEKLEGYLTAIAARQQLVEGLDQDIWDGIDPLRISQDDEKTVRQLMERYSIPRIEEQELLTNRQSLLDAADVLRALEDEVIPARVFQNLMATKETFTYRGVLANGSGYTLTYDGSSVQAVRDVKAGVRLQEGDQTVKRISSSDCVCPGRKYERLCHIKGKERCIRRQISALLAESRQTDHSECKKRQRQLPERLR